MEKKKKCKQSCIKRAESYFQLLCFFLLMTITIEFGNQLNLLFEIILFLVENKTSSLVCNLSQTSLYMDVFVFTTFLFLCICTTKEKKIEQMKHLTTY